MADAPLRVLLVENRADDARLIQRELERGGYRVSARRVETAEAMRQALREQDWDLVIADYVLPAFSGPAALALLHELDVDLPFIVVSGSVGEEPAIEMMRAGAQDFVTKDNLRRLLPAVQRELRQAEGRRQRRRADAELHASRQQLEAILGGMAEGALVQDASGRFIYANEAAARLAGFDSAAEYLNATAAEVSARLEVLDADGRPFDYAQLPGRRALRGEAATPEMVVQFRRRDTGQARWSLTRARVVHGADGQPLAISIFHDLTERIQAERRLQFLAEAGARLGTSLDEGQTLAAVTDVAVHTLANWAVVYLCDDTGQSLRRAALAQWAPVPAAEPTASLPDQLGPDSFAWQVLQEQRPRLLRESAQPAPSNAELVGALRALGLASAAYVPLQARGHTLGVLALFTTQRSGRQLGPEELAVAEELGRRAALAVDNARLYAQARDAISARDEFLSIASHELRTPVTAVTVAAQLLRRSRQRGDLDAERIERFLNTIERTAAHLGRLTEDLLDVARLRQGRLPLRLRQIDLAELVRGAVAQDQARDNRPPLLVTLACEPCPIVADADRLEQVLANLLDNAAKYSPGGQPIEVSLVEEGEGVLLSVRDHGIGLPPGSTEWIFEPFGRAPNATRENIPGLGLGLYICRQIAERHGGRLWAESPGEGLGTSLRLWLPRQADEAAEAAEASPRLDA